MAASALGGACRRRGARPTLVVNFTDEGFLDRGTMEGILGARGESGLRARLPALRRRPGIHDTKGRKVGEISHVKNEERLFLVREDPAVFAGL